METLTSGSGRARGRNSPSPLTPSRVQSGGGSTVMPLATRTTYPNTTTAGAQATSYAYKEPPKDRHNP